MKTQILLSIIFVSISLCFVSCSDLSRGEAKDIILNNTDADWYSIYLSPSFNSGLNSYHFVYSKNHKFLEQKLVENGFIRYKMSYFGLDYYGLTDKILPYKTSRNGMLSFKLAELEDINITGITGNESYKKVEFIILYSATDIGKLILESTELTKEKSLTFKQYDDGWRLD